MKKSYEFNAKTRTLTVYASFMKKLNDINSEEFRVYSRYISLFPDLSLKTMKKSYRTADGKKTTCNPYKGLTYENMMQFIEGLEHPDKYLEQFKFAKERASKIKASRYKTVREWFVKQFPNYQTDPVSYYETEPDVIYIRDFRKSTSEKSAMSEKEEAVSVQNSEALPVTGTEG